MSLLSCARSLRPMYFPNQMQHKISMFARSSVQVLPQRFLCQRPTLLSKASSSLFSLRHRNPAILAKNNPSFSQVFHISTSRDQEITEEKPKRNIYSTWIDHLPSSIAPYFYLTRIDKPTGTWLLYWPCAWSISMATYAHNLPVQDSLKMMALFGVGALVMRGAGCTINDMWDKDFDNKVERTKTRPLASGDITQFQALCFLGLQLSAGLGVLTQLNMYSILLGASSMGLVITYPLMKRVTYWPQVVLGLAFNWGALLGWSAMVGTSDWTVTLPLYASGVYWTLFYDTIYAHQDKKDDIQVGIKSTALRFGAQTPEWLTGFAVSSVGLLGLAGYMNGHGLPFYMGLSAAAAHYAWQLKTVNYDDTRSCWSKFSSNRYLGGLIFTGIWGDILLQQICS
ncbi:4-hydroxybenzoate polyprenyltransferase, mitochondrial [Basidiobolus ranarum]|uniref:4-hydroxybenzoate polyprenyltransferase, mitochondrial n=1 Tax=Basidiobolus ranarum TaxID=34480 RepID=A0ABR2X0K6_9FUNG